MSGTADVNDLHRQGVRLDEMVDAARARPAVTVQDEAARTEAAEIAIAMLDELGTRLADDLITADVAVEAVTALMEDGPLAALALGWMRKSLDMQRRLMSMALPHGAKAARTALVRLIKAKAREMEIADEEEQARLASRGHRIRGGLLQGLPGGLVQLNVPPGWRLDANGVAQLRSAKDDEWTQVTEEPLLIHGIASDLHTGEVWWLVAWRVGGRWISRSVPRETCLQTRTIVTLARWGAPIGSDNAATLVSFLRLLEASNREVLTTTTVTRVMGWQDREDCSRFVLGNTSIHGELEPVSLASDERLEAHAEPWTSKGSWEGWCATVKRHLDELPAAALAIYASACSPLLKVLGIPGFCISWDGRTSKGKTTTLRVGASVWGRPSIDDGIIRTWAATEVGIEQTCTMLRNLPLLLDDTKSAGQWAATKVPNALYKITAGGSNTRGSTSSLPRAHDGWCLAMLSTGERPITSFSADEGAILRVLSIRGAPMGDLPESDPGYGALDLRAKTLNMEVMEDYGHLGPRLVAWLVQHPEEHGPLRRYFLQLDAWASAQVRGTGKRAAAYVAVLALTADILHRHLGMPRFACDPIEVALASVADSENAADKPTEALGSIVNWALLNQHRFWGRHPVDRSNQPILNNMVGSWEAGELTWRHLGINRDVLFEELERRNFDANGIFEEWKRRGWVEFTVAKDEDGNEKSLPSILLYVNDKHRARFVGIRRDAIAQHTGTLGKA